MRKSRFCRALSLLLAVLMAMGCFVLPAAAAEEGSVVGTGTTLAELVPISVGVVFYFVSVRKKLQKVTFERIETDE